MGLVQGPVFENVEMNFSELIVKAQRQYLENGITTVQDGASTEETIQLTKNQTDDGLLKLDTIAYPLMTEDARKL